MTRRDRAACVLALEWVREGWHIDCLTRAVWTLNDARGEAAKIADPLIQRWDGEEEEHVRRPATWQEQRLLRARLALYLRALLRADAGDFGPLLCAGCGEAWPSVVLGVPAFCYYGVGRGEKAHRTRPLGRRIRPLWEDAPPTK